MQRQLTFGGGVSPRNTRLRGQSIIEYVLIAAVIGLVIVFAGPGVAGAIRNQFNQVTNTVDSGTEGDNFMSAEEKAYQEAMKTVAQKEAKDWTLDERRPPLPTSPRTARPRPFTPRPRPRWMLERPGR